MSGSALESLSGGLLADEKSLYTLSNTAAQLGRTETGEGVCPLVGC